MYITVETPVFCTSDSETKKQFLEEECVTKPQIMRYAAIKLPQMSYTVPNNIADRTSPSFKWWFCISQHVVVPNTEQSIIKEKQSNSTLG
jgi:hypothetical protein